MNVQPAHANGDTGMKLRVLLLTAMAVATSALAGEGGRYHLTQVPLDLPRVVPARGIVWLDRKPADAGPMPQFAGKHIWFGKLALGDGKPRLLAVDVGGETDHPTHAALQRRRRGLPAHRRAAAVGRRQRGVSLHPRTLRWGLRLAPLPLDSRGTRGGHPCPPTLAPASRHCPAAPK